uniref:DNA-binding protein n=1 Tax=uncultured Thiotrichaceae bacterium TaxID=298394 RepID=A0A6S6S9L6_9GAMM|nr:MAG: DNA-binding protein [uncultured Thiotrichaceae bacterium]
MPFRFLTPDTLLRNIAAKAKARRLTANLTRRTLAVKSGVNEASIKRFETTGEINFHSLLKLAFSLDCMDEFESLFAEKAPQSMNDLQTKSKQRGRL